MKARRISDSVVNLCIFHTTSIDRDSGLSIHEYESVINCVFSVSTIADYIYSYECLLRVQHNFRKSRFTRDTIFTRPIMRPTLCVLYFVYTC